MNTKERLQDFIHSRILKGKTTIQDETSLFEGGVLDSINLTELITFLEEQWGISVSPSDVCLENFNTVSNLARFLEHSR